MVVVVVVVVVLKFLGAFVPCPLASSHVHQLHPMSASLRPMSASVVPCRSSPPTFLIGQACGPWRKSVDYSSSEVAALVSRDANYLATMGTVTQLDLGAVCMYQMVGFDFPSLAECLSELCGEGYHAGHQSPG
ncbi:hypothetical protein BDV95DRAFT_350696 [Massariosphaeria phaeospora]|uniref:Uncharacterized protein n=1 Tax=Massariosphaeria phaeospora TaxID=100035 RepID=A0A7C8MBH8_9PLEO|nr:hypothetical protein BDV95DRAFT_350696 [Massariosphaeria phaeospora]